MPARKRAIEEVDGEDQQDPEPLTPPLLVKLRNMWEFANLMQYIYIFGGVLKISKDVDIETLEMECCKPTPSELLSHIGLALLKFVSSHRGLTPDLFDEYTRRQFDAKAPTRENPFGKEEEPRKFTDFDVFLKIRILHQLSVWTLYNPDRIRQALANENDRNWYVEPLGWDGQDRTYYSLDDNRLYRMTDPSIPEPPKKKKTKKPLRPKAKGSRSSKRQKLANGATNNDEPEDVEESEILTGSNEEPGEQDNGLGLGGAKWECVAITLKDYKEFTNSIRKSKDPNEKALHERMIEEVLPVIEEIAAAQERKAAQRRRELENLERLATAKRSSRIADKHEKLKEQQEAEEVERKRQDELATARREAEKQRKMEAARESRMMTREKRLKDREVKRILHEEELARLESQSQSGDSVDARMSERRRKNELEKKKRELEEWKEAEEEWYFDCSICGIHGKNLDDGTHVMACEKCNVWQHSACHNIKEEEADRDDFHFICSTCKNSPRPIKLNIGSASASPESKKEKKRQQKQKQQTQVNGILPPEGKKKKKTPKAAQPHVNDSSPPRGPPYRTTLPYDPVASIPDYSQPASTRPVYPTQGHFPLPTNGIPPRTADPPFSRHHTNYSPNNGFFGSFASTDTNTSPQLPRANGVQSNNASNVTWHNQYNYNAFRNDFARQRISPYSHHSNTHSSPTRHASPPYSNFPTSRPHPLQSNQQQTPHAATLPPIAASPTPSFSATQGNTDVRFSTILHHNDRTSGVANIVSPDTNSYVPSANQPNVSAVSPVKHSSSPTLPLPQPSSQGQDKAAISAAAPTFHSPPAPSKAGISPVKHDTALIAPPPPSAHGLGVSGFSPNPDVREPAATQRPQVNINSFAAQLPPLQSTEDSNKDSYAFNKIPGPFTTSVQPLVPGLSPSPGLRRGPDNAEKTYSPRPHEQPKPQMEPKPIQIAGVAPAPTLSPSAGLRQTVELPEKKSSPKPSPRPVHSPNYSPRQPTTLPPAPTLSPSVGLSSGVETPNKKQSPQPSLDAEHRLDKTIPPQSLPAAPFSFASTSTRNADSFMQSSQDMRTDSRRQIEILNPVPESAPKAHGYGSAAHGSEENQMSEGR